MRAPLTIIGTCLLLCFSALLATAAEEPQAAISPLDNAPQHLSGVGPSLATGSDPDYRNVVAGGVSGGASYDTKGYATGTSGGTTLTTTSDIRYFLQPSVAVRQTLQTAIYTISYTPGISGSQHGSDNTEFTQNAAGDILWAPTQRWTLHARQDYSVTTNPFETVGRVALLPELGGLFGPIYNGVFPTVKRTTLVSNGDVSYKLSARSAIGVTAGYQTYDFGQAYVIIGPTPVLYNAQQFNGSVFFSEQITRHQAIGVQATYSDQYVHAIESRTQVPSVLVFDEIVLRPKSVLTVFGGPSYPRSSGLFPIGTTPLGPLMVSLKKEGWEPLVGAVYSWNGHRNAVNAQYLRQVTNPGGLLSTVLSNYGTASFRSHLVRRWTGSVRIDIDDEQLWTAGPTNYSFRTIAMGGGLTYDITRHFWARLDAAYVKQVTHNLYYAPGDHALVQLTIDYHFLKGIGR